MDDGLTDAAKEKVKSKLNTITEEINNLTTIIEDKESNKLSFSYVDDKIAEIKKAIAESGQRVPENDAEMISCIYHSLAERYKEVLDMLQELAPFKIEKLHIIGGGSANALLNQWTADAIGMPVIAGPTEATAIGNLMMQAKAAGLVAGRWEMRRKIAETVQVKQYLPIT